MANGKTLYRIEQGSLVCKMMHSMTPVKNYCGMKIWWWE